MLRLTPKRGLSQAGSDSTKKRRLVTESYDEKLERRHENRQSLFGRNNITSCRSSPRQRSVELNSRQEEFFKRRNLTIGENVVRPKSPTLTRCRVKISNVTASTTDPDVNLVPSQANFIAATQLTLSNDGMPFGNQLSHWGTKESSLTFPTSSLIQSKAVIKKVSKKDKATQVPSTESDEFGNLTRREASQQTECGVAVLDQEIRQLSEYLQEALHRELMLKQKMRILQQLLATVLQAAEKSWKVQLDDDSLRCKLHSLETQLHTWAQNHSRDSVKENMIKMQEQKLRYEQLAKESLQRSIEEKIEVEQSLDNVQRSLRAAKQESVHWRDSYQRAMADYAEVTARHTQTTDRLHVVESKLQRAESDSVALKNLQSRLEAAENETQELLEQIDALKEDSELKQNQLLITRAELQNAEEQKQRMVSTTNNLQNMLQKKVIEATEWEKMVQQNGEFRARTEQYEVALQLEIRQLTDQLETQSSQLHAKQEECTELHSKLTAVWNERHAPFQHLEDPHGEPRKFQKRPAQRRCRCMASFLMAAVVAGFAVLWANLDKIPF